MPGDYFECLHKYVFGVSIGARSVTEKIFGKLQWLKPSSFNGSCIDLVLPEAEAQQSPSTRDMTKICQGLSQSSCIKSSIKRALKIMREDMLYTEDQSKNNRRSPRRSCSCRKIVHYIPKGVEGKQPANLEFCTW